MDKIYCVIRKEWVAASPEEYVRQQFIQHMIMDCGFPASLLAVEKSLKQLPHIPANLKQHIPNRRADILSYTHEKGGLTPLLIIECKSVKLTDTMINQVVGYNRFVQASFIALVNQKEIYVGQYDIKNERYLRLNYLPHFNELTRRFT